MNEELLAVLKQEALRAEALARGAEQAYRVAATNHWLNEIAVAAGREWWNNGPDHPLFVTIYDNDEGGSPKELGVVGIDVNCDLDVNFETIEKTRKGKWSKNVYFRDARTLIQSIVTNELT